MRAEQSQDPKKVSPSKVEEKEGKKEVIEKPVVKEYQPRIPYPSWLK